MNTNYLRKLVFSTAFLAFSFCASAQDQNEISKIRSKSDLNKLQTMRKNLSEKATSEKEKAMIMAKQKGWKSKMTTSDGRYQELERVVDGKPIYYTTFNVDAAESTRTDHLHSGGSLGLNLMGQNMTAHVWDGGLARSSHQEYDGAGGTNRFSVGDGSSTLNFHAAHVTGTIIASGVQSSAKGMAPHAEAIGYDWNSDTSEAASAASDGMLVSNHSYGYAARDSFGNVQLPEYFFGGYIDVSQEWDEIMFNAPYYLMVVAAGNDGNDNSLSSDPTGGFGFDKLSGHATAKNNLVVANANDANIDANGNLNSVSINSSSSEGPTDDFRIKPDITGNGTNVYSTYESSNTAYASITGTSMASPNVTGSLLVLQQHYNNTTGNFMRSATLKGLALHTADDAGASGPDAVFGWGLLNAKKAAETITNEGEFSQIEELTLNQGESYSITVDSDGTSPLLASISWTDRAGVAVTSTNSTTPVLVNDLDIRVSKNGTSYFPYELTGATTSATKDNDVDPYERVDINGAAGTYTVTVTHKGTLTSGSQNFSMIITGITADGVIDDGGEEEEEEENENPIDITYCDSEGSDSSFEWIDYVSFGGIENSTSNDGGYADYTSLTASVAPGETETLVISAGFASTAYTEFWKIWIDYDQNGTFDEDEILGSGSSSSSGNLSVDVTIPIAATLGVTTMRVSMKYDSEQTACETFSYGEVEDYAINITNNSNFSTFASKSITAFDEGPLSSVLGFEEASSFKVYPNPSIDFVKINIESTRDIEFEIKNVVGELISKGRAINGVIDVVNIQSGIYFLSANDGQKTFTTKLIKK